MLKQPIREDQNESQLDMRKTSLGNRRSMDIWLFIAFFLLILLGIIMIYSASAYYAEGYFGDNFFFIKKHLVWLFIGLIAMALAYNFPYRRLSGRTGLLLIFALGIMVYLALIKKSRWFIFGPIHFQGIDVAKFALIFFFADSLSRKERDLQDYSKGFFPHFLYLFIFGLLTVLQPDFSSTLMMFTIGFTMLFVSPGKIKHLLATGLGLIPFLILAIWLNPYMRDRLIAHKDFEANIMDKAYQVNQSLISLGSGGIAGVGYAESKQKMFFLPEAHTDFIFSIIGEEWGLIGTTFVVLLFFIILFRGVKIARNSFDRFSFYLTVGITTHFVIYAMTHMMVTLRLVPPTGLPLPFISYGGTFMLFSCIYAGLLLNLSNQAFSERSVRQQRFTRRATENLQLRKLKYLR